MPEIRNGKLLYEVVREYFPDASDDYVEYLIWNETGFPGFWNGDPEDCFRLQLAVAACRENFAMFEYFDNEKVIESVLAQGRGLSHA